MRPTVTIVSPCYNHERYVVESLDSIRSQDYPDIQHIIIDDGSTDGSRRVIQEWIDRNEYPCEFIKRDANKGLCYSLNESIERAKGEFWTSFGTDDVMRPHRTSVMAKYLTDNPDAMLVMCDAEYIDGEGRPTTLHGHSTVLRAILSSRPEIRIPEDFGTFESLFGGCHCPSWLVRMSTFAKVGVYDEDLRVEDWDMWLRISQHGRIPYIDEPLIKYRWHGENGSRLVPFMYQQALLTLMKHYHAARERLPQEVVDKVYLRYFHDAIATPRDFSLLWKMLKSPARPVAWKGLAEYFRNWRESRGA